MPTPHLRYLRDFERLLAQGRRLPNAAAPARPVPRARAGAPTVLILAPHPDDECLMGVLPRRLQRESGWRVIAVAATLGSRLDRRDARRAEMSAACARLGWEFACAADRPLHEIVRDARPELVLLPHRRDANATHRAVHRRALAALRRAELKSGAVAAETEYWSTLEDPNALVEADPAVAADLLAALTCHAGEVARNPYHALWPCWLADGARRGAELVGGRGAAADGASWASLYRLSRWNGKRLVRLSAPRMARVDREAAQALDLRAADPARTLL